MPTLYIFCFWVGKNGLVFVSICSGLAFETMGLDFIHFLVLQLTRGYGLMFLALGLTIMGSISFHTNYCVLTNAITDTASDIFGYSFGMCLKKNFLNENCTYLLAFIQ